MTFPPLLEPTCSYELGGEEITLMNLLGHDRRAAVRVRIAKASQAVLQTLERWRSSIGLC